MFKIFDWARDDGGTLNFACTTEFWRMGVLWTISLLLSYLQLFARTFFSRKPISHPRRSPSPPTTTTSTSTPTTSPTRRPVCIITGATSRLGAAAAYSLSMEGFFVVFDTLSLSPIHIFLFSFLSSSPVISFL